MATKRKYVIIDTSSKSLVDFSQVIESEDDIRYSIDGTKFIVKFEGDTPSSISSLSVPEYSHDSILSKISGTDWTPEEEEGLYD